MRDIALVLLVAALLVMVLRRAHWGAYVWAWLSMMNPHKMAYGFAYNFPFAQTTAIVTLAAMLFSRSRRPFPIQAITLLQVTLLLWMSVTCLFALNTTEAVTERWVFVMKIQVMLFVTMMLLRGRQQIEALIWVVTLSIGFFGIKGGIWTVLTGGGSRVWGPPGGLIQGNNELAVALVMCVPLMAYLLQVSKQRWQRWLALGSIVTTAFAILGTQSRGALLALLAMTAFLGIKGRRPVRNTVLLATLVSVAVLFMPETWTARMETIQTYEGDASAMSRIYSWTTLWNAAVDRPLVGAGFRADTMVVYQTYAPQGPQWEVFRERYWVAHSIYLQMLGEHGFVGLGLFIALFGATWRRAGQLARRSREVAGYGDWVPKLMPMIQVSLVGYAAGGAFLSLAYFDLPYYLIAFVVLVDATMRSEASHPGQIRVETLGRVET